MDLKTLRAELQKLAALAEGWDASHEIADIERDLALGKLRELYDAVRFGLDSAVQPSVEDELSPVDLPPMEIDLDAVIPLTAMSEPFGADPAAAPLEEPTIAPPVVESPVAGPSEAPFAAAPAVEPVGTPAEVPAEMPAETAVPAEIPLQAPAEAPVEERTEIPAEAVEGTVGAPVVEPTVDPIGEIPAEAVATVSEPSDATDSEGAPVVAEAPAVVAEPLSLFELDPVDVKRAKHRVVLSLYGDTDSVTPAAVGQEPVADLRQALCNNDRFLLARDLFGGDMDACGRTIDRLNEFDDLDECMIYIAENFDWNPNSDGAKLLVDLIERKLA